MTSDLRVTREHLDVADDGELVGRALAPAYHAVSIYDGAEVLAAHLGRLTGGQRALLALHWCISETMNGGFDQFFLNPSGLLADEARAAFERIGVPEAAALLSAAAPLFASRPPDPDPDDPEFDEADEDERFQAYRARYEPLEERFYALIDPVIVPRSADYVRAHPAEFAR